MEEFIIAGKLREWCVCKLLNSVKDKLEDELSFITEHETDKGSARNMSGAGDDHLDRSVYLWFTQDRA